jgi:hypothetical protein
VFVNEEPPAVDTVATSTQLFTPQEIVDGVEQLVEEEAETATSSDPTDEE